MDHRAHPTLSCLHTVCQQHVGKHRLRLRWEKAPLVGTMWGPAGQGYPAPLELSTRCCSLLERGRPPYSAPVCSLRRNYKALCQMYEKIRPLLENLHGNFTETRNNIGEQRKWGGLARGEGSCHSGLFLVISRHRGLLGFDFGLEFS